MLALTLTNPMTILSFGAIFASLGLVEGAGNYGAALTMTSGVFLGSLLWWIGLCGVMSLIRHRITTGVMTWLNRIAGGLIALFGIAALVGARHHGSPHHYRRRDQSHQRPAYSIRRQRHHRNCPWRRSR